MSRNENFEDFESRISYKPIVLTNDEEQAAPKVELGSPKTPMVFSRGPEPLGKEEETLAPFISIWRP